MNRFQFARAGLALLAVACMSAVAMAQELKLGSKAPALPVHKWIKGDKVKEFKSGQVYVVEFWATWCPPCLESIPHLTEMAKKYGDKVNFVGISVYEDSTATSESAYLPKVEKFVADMGKKMDYNVAVDTWDGKVAKEWMEAADQDGIPTAFIVDKTGTIAWIGHPMDGLDETLGGVLDGSYDVKAVVEIEALLRAIQDAFDASDLDGALMAIDAAVEKHPELETFLAPKKFETLIGIREQKAYDYARKLKDGLFKNDPMQLNSMAWAIIDPAETRKNPDVKLALEMSEQALKLLKEDSWQKAMIMDTNALALFKSGKVKEAIDAQTKAVKMAKESEEGKAGADVETLAEMEARLEEFKKKG
jgi:thiol-disulfide isomerase/thioredoxin